MDAIKVPALLCAHRPFDWLRERMDLGWRTAVRVVVPVGGRAVGHVVVPGSSRLTRLEPDATPSPNVVCWAASLILQKNSAFALRFFRAPKGALYTERKFFSFRPGTNDTKTVGVVAVVRVAAEPAADRTAVDAVVITATA